MELSNSKYLIIYTDHISTEGNVLLGNFERIRKYEPDNKVILISEYSVSSFHKSLIDIQIKHEGNLDKAIKLAKKLSPHKSELKVIE